jgi:hypothetical protein
MAFGVSSLKAWGIQAYEGNRDQFLQVLQMDITGLAADVALDIGNPTGTFWTGVGNAALNQIVQDIFTRVDRHVSISVPELYAKTLIRSGASTGANDYKIASPQNTSFAITIHTGEGLTAYSLTMTWALKPDHAPVIYLP